MSELFEHKETHPTYGMIGASRVSAQPGVYCFGSRIRHNAFVEITIRGASLSRHLNHDHYFADNELISVRLTEAQWATFVSSPNVGMGVPCSLDHVLMERCGEVPPPADSISQAKHEARKEAAELMEQMNALCGELEKAVEEPKKRELRDILRRLKCAVGYFPSNHAYLFKSFEEHVENVVTDAKASVEAHFTAVATRAGFALDGKVEVPQIEGASEAPPQQDNGVAD